MPRQQDKVTRVRYTAFTSGNRGNDHDRSHVGKRGRKIHELPDVIACFNPISMTILITPIVLITILHH